jgi:hypothetical protein
MPLTILENIAVELERRLNLMVANTTYGTNVFEVIRPVRLDAFTPKHRQIVLTQGDEEIVEELSCQGNPPSVARRQKFNIRCHLMTDEKSLEPIDTTINAFASDVMACVSDDYSTWHTFDGNAIDSAWGTREMISADGGIDGINIPIYITYRTDENDPYNIR